MTQIYDFELKWIKIMYFIQLGIATIISLLIYMAIALECVTNINLSPIILLLLFGINEYCLLMAIINIILFKVWTYPLLYLYRYICGIDVYSMEQYDELLWKIEINAI